MPLKIAPDVEAQIQAAILAGAKQADLARHYGMPRSTITRIRMRMNEEQVVNGSAQRIVEASTNLDERLAELLAESLSALIGIAKTTQDEAYRKSQNAAALATLYEKIAATTLQILSAASEANDTTED
jgi:DNA-binding IclR family transcriptional regulator